MPDYQDRLREHLVSYKGRHLPGLDDGIWHYKGELRRYPHVLPKDQFGLNILPTIRESFWPWFKHRKPAIKLHRSFHHLNSSQALTFNLFFPFLREDGATVDARLIEALGVKGEGTFKGYFEKVLPDHENANFDFYLENDRGRRIFFELKLSENEFGTCEGDDEQCLKLERHYRPYLQDHVDAKWLNKDVFFRQYRILRNISYLGRYPDSGLVFIFPKANETLRDSEEAIKQIVSKSLAPRVAILYLEYLVGRILTIVQGDDLMSEHYLEIREKYLV